MIVSVEGCYKVNHYNSGFILLKVTRFKWKIAKIKR